MNPLHLDQHYQIRFGPSMASAFKVDEGYSEDTRSQDDVDSAMRIEPGSHSIATHSGIVASMPEGIMALNEAERSGEVMC